MTTFIMSEEDNHQADTSCASCGIAEIDDIKLKDCDDCDLVRYCSDACQRDHKTKHKEACKKRAAELDEKIETSRLLGEQVAKIGEAVKKWQSEKGEIKAKIAGILNFQKLVLDHPDEAVLEFITDVRRQLKEQQSGE